MHFFFIFKLTSYNCCWPHESRKFRRKITQQKHKRKWKESGKNTTECRNLIFFRYYISYSIICINFSINDIYEWVANVSMTKYIKNHNKCLPSMYFPRSEFTQFFRNILKLHSFHPFSYKCYTNVHIFFIINRGVNRDCCIILFDKCYPIYSILKLLVCFWIRC